MASTSPFADLQQLQEENRQLRQEVEALKQRLQLSTQHQVSAGWNGPSQPALPGPGTAGDCGAPSFSSQPRPATPLQPHHRGSSAPCPEPGNGAPVPSLGPLPAAAACSITAERPASIGTHGLSKSQVERYSRQLLLPSFGPAAQARLCAASALVVGCGGLGAPAALYLAASGIGTLGLADHDTVELSNLHRQVIHAESRVGQHKASSAAASCSAINSSVRVQQHTHGLTPANAVQLVASYDVALDCSDNAATRYLLSDACATCQVPLVSAAALGTDGQLTVYCHGADGPCYRCLFPTPPAAQHCGRCSEAGVLGPVPGVMGVLQALEAIKLLTGVGEPLSRKLLLFDALSGRFSTVRLRGKVPGCVACSTRACGDATRHDSTTQVPSAAAAAAAAAGCVMTRDSIATYDYAAFTGQAANDGPDAALALLPREQRVSAQELAAALGLTHAGARADDAPEAPAAAAANLSPADATIMTHPTSPGAAGVDTSTSNATAQQLPAASPVPVVLDVRPATQFSIMALPGAIHVPIDQLEVRLPEVLQRLQCQATCLHQHTDGGQHGSKHEHASRSSDGGGDWCQNGGQEAGTSVCSASGSDKQHMAHGKRQQCLPPVYVVCRRGNDSQLAVQLLRRAGVHTAVDLIGGYQSWARDVDTSVPFL